MSQPPSRSAPFKSKTAAAALAFAFGSLGAHRFYLHGRRDPFGWLHLAGTALGIAGALLVYGSARRSLAGWLLGLPGAASLIAAFLAAIVYGLRPDDRWDARFNPAGARRNRSGWSVVFVTMLSLFVGAMLLMGGLALMFQTYFESLNGTL